MALSAKNPRVIVKLQSTVQSVNNKKLQRIVAMQDKDNRPCNAAATKAKQDCVEFSENSKRGPGPFSLHFLPSEH